MLLAEELALVAIDPESGRHTLGARGSLNACLAGLLVAELLLTGTAQPAPGGGVMLDAVGAAPDSPAMQAAARVIDVKGPKLRAVLSHMSRGLEQELGTGTWDTAVAGLAAAGIVNPARGIVSRVALSAPEVRDEVVTRLRAAASGDGPLDARTAVLLRMTGPAQLLEVVAPERRSRRHARRRIDGALDSAELEAVATAVRKLLADAAAIAAAAGTAAVIASSAGS